MLELWLSLFPVPAFESGKDFSDYACLFVFSLFLSFLTNKPALLQPLLFDEEMKGPGG